MCEQSLFYSFAPSLMHYTANEAGLWQYIYKLWKANGGIFFRMRVETAERA